MPFYKVTVRNMADARLDSFYVDAPTEEAAILYVKRFWDKRFYACFVSELNFPKVDHTGADA